MSLVVIPILAEDPAVVAATLGTAASHPRVTEVACVTARGHDQGVVEQAALVTERLATPVRVVVQRRIGRLRPGKGDAINTGLRFFLEETEAERVHFYDADIATFDHSWIDKAEQAADRGYQAVRHYYPRAATDAMITWFITRLGFARLFPASPLPMLNQPLGGELAFTRPAAVTLATDPAVEGQSDWGIDTLLTFSSVQHGLRIFESYIPAGKDHTLYGPLSDIKTMAVECLGAVQSLRGRELPRGAVVDRDAPQSLSPPVSEKLGYDVDASLALLAEGWSPRQEELCRALPEAATVGLAAARRWPSVAFMDEPTWTETLDALLLHFRLGDRDWEWVAFRAWLARVLNYTLKVAVRGPRYASAYLQETIERAMGEG